MTGGDNSSTVSSVSAEVEAYEPLIRQYANQYGIGAVSYTHLLTTDGNGKPYLHGAVDRAVASISLGDSLEGELTDDALESEDYELLSDEDLEEIIQKYV